MPTGSDAAKVPRSAASLARLLQFGDSMFPIGGFSFSCGLESAIQKNVVTDSVTLRAFARTVLDQSARGDGIGLIAAHRAAGACDIDALIDIDEQVYARKLSAEMRMMSVRMGKKFTELSSQVLAAPLLCKWCECIAAAATPGCYSVALAVNFAAQGLSAQDAFVVHQFGVATAVLGAALRLIRISHIETQKILHELSGSVEEDYEIAAARRLSDMSGYAPLAEILAAVHAKAHVRLFMS